MSTTTTKEIKVKPVKKGDSITIIGRRWFDRVNGNTYHSVQCLINGKPVAYYPFNYGYGDQYIYTGANKLQELGYLPDFTSSTVFWRYCEERGIVLHTEVSDVSQKKDL